MKKKYGRLYLCDQKKPCSGKPECGRDCFMTTDRDHRAAAIDYDEKTKRYTPVSQYEELRDYVTSQEKGATV